MKMFKQAIIVVASIVAIMTIGSLKVNASSTVIVNTDTLNIREKASTDSKSLGLLDNGEKLEYISEEGNWYKVKTKKGTQGYVSKDFTKLQEDKTVETTEKVEEVSLENSKETNPEEAPSEANLNINVTEESLKTESPDFEEPTEIIEAIPTEMKVKDDSKIYILPLINANVLQNIKAGEMVKTITMTNGWVYVETDEVMGWIRKSNLEDSSVVSDDVSKVEDNKESEKKEELNKEETNGDQSITSKVMYINTSSVYMRKGPGTTYEVVDTFVLNNTVKVVAENGDWYKVEVNGTTGYIAKRLLSATQTETTDRSSVVRTNETSQVEVATTEGSSEKGNQVVEMAKTYLGKPYVYGASGPNSFDCSGFTMFIMAKFGVSLSHSATAQSKVGTPVDKANLQPGDLVFFTDYETGVGIGHCGIYVGGGNFIHASSGTGYCVKISTLTSGSYLNRYVTARRVV